MLWYYKSIFIEEIGKGCIKKKIGLLAFSFGSDRPEKEPSNCNLRLLLTVQKIVLDEKRAGNEVVTVVQWEIGRAGIPAVKLAKVIEEPDTSVVTDSSWLMNEAAEVFRKEGVSDVIVVANPFLHRYSCFKLVRKAGFKPVLRKHGHIGFYPGSLTWWTRSPLHLLWYAFRQAVFGYRGNYHTK